jgi:hypothetical protein
MSRIGFYITEIDFMDKNNPRIPGNRLSYQQIADHLNDTWPQFNHGCRTRGTVIDYYNRKRQQAGVAVRMISLPKAISDTLSGDDIQRIIISHAVRIGTKQA